MEEKDKYHAEIDAKLVKLGETLHEIKTKAEKKKKSLSEFSVGETIRKYNNARTKLDQLKQSDKSSWQNHKMELGDLVNDIDEDLRKAMAYLA